MHWGQESLIELISISQWEVVSRWQSPITCRSNELISSIRLNANDQLGLSIQDENNPLNRQFRFEIRDIALNLLRTVPLHVDAGILSRMVSLPDRCWILLNVDENFLFVVNERGELADKISWPDGPLVNVALVGSRTVVIRTSRKLYFYDVDFHQ